MPVSWPWNSLRKACVSWQILERRLLAARLELERRYLDLLRLAESLDLDPNQGLLRAARLTLDQPSDPDLQKSRNRLQKAFALLGKSLWRPAPGALQMESRRFAGHIEALVHKYEELGARLVSAQKILDRRRQDPATEGSPVSRLALISPAAARLCQQLRERRRAEHQARQECLVWERRIRLAACRRWLSLLQSSMPAKTFRQFDRSLTELAAKAAGEEGQGGPESPTDRAKVALLSAAAHRQATRTIADLLPRKSN